MQDSTLAKSEGSDEVKNLHNVVQNELQKADSGQFGQFAQNELEQVETSIVLSPYWKHFDIVGGKQHSLLNFVIK